MIIWSFTHFEHIKAIAAPRPKTQLRPSKPIDCTYIWCSPCGKRWPTLGAGSGSFRQGVSPIAKLSPASANDTLLPSVRKRLQRHVTPFLAEAENPMGLMKQHGPAGYYFDKGPGLRSGHFVGSRTSCGGGYILMSSTLPVKGPGRSIFSEVTAAAKRHASSGKWCCLQKQ